MGMPSARHALKTALSKGLRNPDMTHAGGSGHVGAGPCPPRDARNAVCDNASSVRLPTAKRGVPYRSTSQFAGLSRMYARMFASAVSLRTMIS